MMVKKKRERGFYGQGRMETTFGKIALHFVEG